MNGILPAGSHQSGFFVIGLLNESRTSGNKDSRPVMSLGVLNNLVWL